MIISVVDGPSPTLNERKKKEQKQTKKTGKIDERMNELMNE